MCDRDAQAEVNVGWPLVLSLLIVGVLTSCGPSEFNQEREGPETTPSRAEIRTEQKAKTERLITELLEKYKGTLFPPSDFPSTPFTAHLQRALLHNEGSPVVFLGHLDDVAHHEGSYVVEFHANANGSFLSPTIVMFRLVGSSANVEGLLAKGANESPFPGLRYLADPRFLIAADVNSVRVVRRYEGKGSVVGEEDVEVDIATSRRYLVSGELLEVVALETEEGR